MSDYKSYVVWPTAPIGRVKGLPEAIDEINSRNGSIISTHVLPDGRILVIALLGEPLTRGTLRAAAEPVFESGSDDELNSDA